MVPVCLFDLSIVMVVPVCYNLITRLSKTSAKVKGGLPMSNPNMESQIKELLELKRMKEELEAEIAVAEDTIKAVMGEEETLLAGAFKVSWKNFTSSRLDSTALKKALPEIAAQFTKQTTVRRFSIN